MAPSGPDACMREKMKEARCNWMGCSILLALMAVLVLAPAGLAGASPFLRRWTSLRWMAVRRGSQVHASRRASQRVTRLTVNGRDVHQKWKLRHVRRRWSLVPPLQTY